MARKRNTDLEHFLGSHPKFGNDHWSDQMMVRNAEVAANRRLVHAHLPMKLSIPDARHLECDVILFGKATPRFIFNMLYLINGRRNGFVGEERVPHALRAIQ